MVAIVPAIAIAVAAFIFGRKSASPLFVVKKGDPRFADSDRVAFSPSVANRVASDMASWGIETADPTQPHVLTATPGTGSSASNAQTLALAAHAAGLDVWVSTDAGPTPRRPGSRVVAFIPAGNVPDTSSTTIAAVTIADALASLKQGGSLLVLLAAANEPFPVGVVSGPTTAPAGPPGPPPGQGVPGSPGGPGLGAGKASDDGLDPSMPPVVRQATLALLAQATDPQVLLAAAQVDDNAGFPIAAAKLRARAAKIAPATGPGSGAGFEQGPHTTAQIAAAADAAVVALGNMLGQPIAEEPGTPDLTV